MPAAAKTNPIKQLSVGHNGELRPVMYMNTGQGLADVRTVSGEVLARSAALLAGSRILVEVGQKSPANCH